MRLGFCPTIGQRLYYMGDLDDDYAPMLQLTFCNEFAEGLTSEQKQKIALEVFDLAIKMINEAKDK